MRINDISINIGKEKIRTGVIFLSGFAVGGIASAIVLKSKITKRVEAKWSGYLYNLYEGTEKTAAMATDALDKVKKSTEKLEAALRDSEPDNRKLYSN